MAVSTSDLDQNDGEGEENDPVESRQESACSPWPSAPAADFSGKPNR